MDHEPLLSNGVHVCWAADKRVQGPGFDCSISIVTWLRKLPQGQAMMSTMVQYPGSWTGFILPHLYPG